MSVSKHTTPWCTSRCRRSKEFFTGGGVDCLFRLIHSGYTSHSMAAPKQQQHTSMLRDAAELALCAGGIYGCYLFYGVLHEKM